ncbi:MAG: GAF domain-containing protein [Anaerolineae bacterium]|nr:GAF domain-containing protein [Anaerolineae bacterium]MDX9830302.1 GAF domain-containing protein [Anaerolineae bacterium]
MSRLRWPHHNLALQLLALYLLFVAPILIAALFFDALASQRLRADVAAADLRLAQAIALETDALLVKARQAVEAFAHRPEVVAMDLAGMEESFGDATLARQDINLFYRLDARGIMVFHYPTGPGSTVGVDFSYREYFQAAQAGGRPVFSVGRVSPTTQRPVATVVAPVRIAGGRFDGVVAANLELQRLSETLAVLGQDLERGVQVTMVDAAGQVVAHSQSQESLLHSVLDTLPGASQALAGQEGSFTGESAGGREWLYSYASIPSAGWGVIVQRPVEIAFATSRAFHRGLLLAIGIIALGAALFWWGLSHRVIRPLEQLTRFSRAGRSAPGRSRDEAGAGRELEALRRRQDQVGDLARTLQRRLHELETLLETSTAVVSSLDTEQVIDSILEQVQRLLDVDTCAVLLVDQATQQLRVHSSRGLSDHYVQELRLEPSPRELPAWRAIDNGQPVQIADVEKDPAMASLLPLIRPEGYRALLVVPLITLHGPPAVLVVYRADVHVFGTEEVNLAVTFANQAAMALENATLFSQTDKELQKQVHSLTILNRVMLTASQSLVLDDVLTNALDAVMDVTGADAAWIHLLAADEPRLQLRAQRGLRPRLAALLDELPLGFGLVGRVAQTGQTLREESLDGEEDLRVAVEEGFSCMAGTPLRAKEAVVGVLGAATCAGRSLSEDEVALLSAIGGPVGIAVENARLYQYSRQVAILEERNRLAREIHDALAQGLTGIIVQLEVMERLAPRRPDQALASLHRAKDLARKSLQEARRSVWGLRPRSLEDMTLVEALRARVEALRSEQALHASFGVSGARRILSPDVELNLFRIAQEALANLQRHARAQTVHVQLDYGQAHLRLVVEDDGVGFEEGAPAGEHGDEARRAFGLIGMRERAMLLGGQLTITSQLGEGTRVEVIVPG